MTEKEKAKAHDEAIERTKKIYGNGIIEEIFPELKEEDAERIRKNCIHFLELQKQHHAATFEIEECIDWLEKQGLYNETQKFPSIPFNSLNNGKNEQKTTNKTELKFKVGNWYQCTKNFVGKGVIFDRNTAYYCAQEGCLQDEYGCHIAIVKDLYDNFKLWTIQDAKDGDVLVNGSNIFIFYFINNRRLMGYCHVNMNDGNFYNDIGRIECFCTIDAPVTPATKEQRDALMKAMNDAGYVWDAEKKELMELIKPKFDPKTLQPFDKVLVRDDSLECWEAQLFSHIIKDENHFPYVCTNDSNRYCIPYNDDTKHLVGTTDEAPVYYRYWED